MKLSHKVILLVVLVAMMIPALLMPQFFAEDDSFFYFQIAGHIAAGHGSTFHQITPTNTYHPVWMLFCVLSAFLAGGNNITAMQIGYFIQQLFLVGILYFLFKTALLFKIKNYIIGLPLIASIFCSWALYGSEAHVNGFFYIWMIYYLFKNLDSNDIKKRIILGILLGFVFLARLDNIFVVFIVFIYLFYRNYENGLRGIFRIIFQTGLPFLIIAGVYLLYNYSYYGHITPISGALKSTFPTMTAAFHSIGKKGLINGLIGVFSIIFGIFIKSDKLKKELLIVLGLCVIIPSLYVYLFTDNVTVWGWYYVLGYINLAFLLIYLMDFISTKFVDSKKFAVVNYCLFAVLCLYGILFSWSEYFNPECRGYSPVQFSQSTRIKWQDEIGIWLNKNLPKGSAILVTDWPGRFAYFSSMKIMSTDGLVNDYNYQKEIVDIGIVRYLKEKNIKYMIGPYEQLNYERRLGYQVNISKNNYEFEIYSLLKNQNAGKFILHDSDIIVKFPDIIPSSFTQKLALYKLNI